MVSAAFSLRGSGVDEAPCPGRRRDTEHRLNATSIWVTSASPYLVPLSFVWGGRALLVATATGRNLPATQTTRLALGHTRDVAMIDGTAEVLDINALPQHRGDRFAARTGFYPRVLLLEAGRFPRDKVCGDALTQRAVRVLSSDGCPRRPPLVGTMRGARVHMRGRGRRDFLYDAYPGGDGHCLVVPRVLLDDALRTRAVAVGAELWEGATVTAPIVEDGQVVGVWVRRDGHLTDVRAATVVAADGARSALPDPAGHVGLG
ncbi:NAD(P)/FAD-dependent oxidoreductase [Streptomyces pilosus]|uniref:NAD(P)/FAD-dependent oxidoreductase n=1 Tax=Streptomyces pilosus TaxID=28893 RepID=UPI00363C947D